MEDIIKLNKIDKILDELILKYSDSENSFINHFKLIEKDDLILIIKMSLLEDYYDNEYFDTFDKAKEIMFYFNTFKLKYQIKPKPKKYGSFTLRNPQDLIIFEEFLDKMIKLLELSPKHFLNIFPKCPVLIWDKIDDLRETSYKLERDSEEYTRCLRKCKRVSFAFSELSGLNDNNE